VAQRAVTARTGFPARVGELLREVTRLSLADRFVLHYSLALVYARVVPESPGLVKRPDDHLRSTDVTDWDPSAVAAVLRTENRFPGGAVVGVLAVGHAQTRMWVLESELLKDGPEGRRVHGNPVILAGGGLDEVGSELFDRLLLERAVSRITEIPGADEGLAGRLQQPPGEPWGSLRMRLVAQVRRARGELAAWHSATVDVDGIPGISPDGPVRLDRIELDNALRPYVLQMARDFSATIEGSGFRPAQLDGIYLLGDAGMPLIVRSVYDVLGVSPTVGSDLVAAGDRARAAGGETPSPPARNGSARSAGVPEQARPVSPAHGLSLRPTPPKNGRVVIPGTTVAKPEPVMTPASVNPDDAEVYRPEDLTETIEDDGGDDAVSVGTVEDPVAEPPAVIIDPPVAKKNGTTNGHAVAKVNGTPVAPVVPKAPELTDTGSLRLLRDEGDGFDEGRLDGTTKPKRRRLRVVPVLGGISVLVAAGLIVFSLVQGGRPANPDPVASAGPLTPASTSLPTVSPTPEVVALPAVAGLAARRVGIAIALTWDQVEGADRYEVYRDAGTPAEKIRTAVANKLTDRPGDGLTHAYTVIALDADKNAGESGAAVEAKAATPYGKLQNIASTWTGIVPEKPGQKGAAGQVCRPKTGKVNRIICRYPDQLTLAVFGYGSDTATDHRYNVLAKGKGVKSSTWKTLLHDDVKDTGRLLTGAHGGSPWRWWSYESAPSYAIQAQWPGHSAADLARWVNKRMPFHT
jgi:hypothetical protein